VTPVRASADTRAGDRIVYEVEGKAQVQQATQQFEARAK
jgi:hypothetical protein